MIIVIPTRDIEYHIWKEWHRDPSAEVLELIHAHHAGMWREIAQGQLYHIHWCRWRNRTVLTVWAQPDGIEKARTDLGFTPRQRWYRYWQAHDLHALRLGRAPETDPNVLDALQHAARASRRILGLELPALVRNYAKAYSYTTTRSLKIYRRARVVRFGWCWGTPLGWFWISGADYPKVFPWLWRNVHEKVPNPKEPTWEEIRDDLAMRILAGELEVMA